MLMKIVFLQIFFVIISTFQITLTKNPLSKPDPVLSGDGYQTLNLFTETAYTIINQGTRKMPCLPSSPRSPDVLNSQHWWKIVPSRNFNQKKPIYELISYDGNASSCAIGRKISFYPTSSSQDEDDNGTETYFLSTDHCRKFTSCPGRDIYNGVILLTQANETIHFCGNSDFTCSVSVQSRYQSRLEEVIHLEEASADSYHFKFLPYSSLAGKYEVVGKLQDFVLANVTQNLKNYIKPQQIEDGWRIGFADEIVNCASFTQEKEVSVEFKSTESSRLEFSKESFNLLGKLSKFSIRAGASLSLPLNRFLPIVDVSSRVEWGSEVTEWSHHSKSKMHEVRKQVLYKYTSKVTIEPWRVAKVSAFLNVVKNLPIPYEGVLTVTAEAIENEGKDCLEEESIRKILTLKGYDLNGAVWNETDNSYRYHLKGEIIVTFGVESYVQVSDKECPPERQVHRSEF